MQDHSNLIREIDELKRLNDLRQEARRLRDRGLQALVAYSSSDHRQRDAWDEEQPAAENDGHRFSAITRVLFRRAKHLAWYLGHLDDCDDPLTVGGHVKEQGYPAWPRLGRLDHDGAREAGHEDLRVDHHSTTSVFFSSVFLRARLGNLPGAFTREFWLTYYRVLREIYNLDKTEWALGGCRAGDASRSPSVFVTSECARSIGFLARALQDTADFLEQIREHRDYLDHLDATLEAELPLDPSWCSIEQDRSHLAIRTTIERYRDLVLIQLGHGPVPAKAADLVDRVVSACRSFLAGSKKTAKEALCEIEAMRAREREQGLHGLTGVRGQWPEADLTNTAHVVARGPLIGARSEFLDVIQKLKVKAWDPLPLLARMFGKLAGWVRGHLAPIARFMNAEMHRAWFEASKTQSADSLQDLAFATMTAGLIDGDWDRDIFKRSTELLCAAVDENGRLPSGPPFAIRSDGAQHQVVNAHAMKALAQLIQHVDVELEPATATRMLRSFQQGATELNGGIAWRRPGAGNSEGTASMWLTSVSALALHRIVLMLNLKINQRVERHFTVKRWRHLKVPPLHRLMCSDIGYASMKWRTHRPESILMFLEKMRAQMLTGRARQALGGFLQHSLIAYGPPGTGKTTLMESLAVTSRTDLVTITPSDFLISGAESLERQASAVMHALRMLTGRLVLFDEFDTVLRDRDRQGAPISTIDFLTGSMLPKLADLGASAKRNRIAYALATNYVQELDAAAIRVGRFDHKKSVYYPDAASRACRLASELIQLRRRLAAAGLPDAAITKKGLGERMVEIVAQSAQVSIANLCRVGWFTAPLKVAVDPATKRITAATERELGPIWNYVLFGTGDSIDWPSPGEPDSTHERMTRKPTRPKNPELLIERAALAASVSHWDVALGDAVATAKDGAKPSWSAMVKLLADPGLVQSIVKTRDDSLADVRTERLRRTRPGTAEGDTNA